jgi:PAS domain S-box-containing protein
MTKPPVARQSEPDPTPGSSGIRPVPSIGKPGGSIIVPPQPEIFPTLAIVFGFLCVLCAILGLAGMRLGIILLSSVYPGYKTIAPSAALIWIVLGLVLVVSAVRPLKGMTAIILKSVLAVIAVIEGFELVLAIFGGHSAFETWMTGIGRDLLGPSSSPISPIASFFIGLSAVALFLTVGGYSGSKSKTRIRNSIGIAGLVIVILSFTFILSYVYGDPLLYGTRILPIAAISALAAFFLGSGLIATAGPGAFPLCHLVGNSTRARMLRIFVPLVIGLILMGNLIFFLVSSIYPVNNAVLLSSTIVLFVIATVYVVARVSMELGNALDTAEQDLVQKNEELNALNEELAASGEELRLANENLTRSEATLKESLQQSAFLADILEHSSQPFGVGYPDGKLGIVNTAFEELTGYRKSELDTIDWAAVLTPPEWREVERSRLEELNRTKKPVRYEKEYIRKDGTRVPIELLAHLVSDKNGNPLYYYSFITDITDRKRADMAVREAQLRTAIILEGIADTFYSLDDQWRFTVVNPAAERAPFGRPAAELLGRIIWDVYPALVGTPIHRHYLDAAEKHSMEHYTSQSPLNGRWYEVFMQGRSGGVDVYMRDVTGRKQAEKALHESHLRLTHHIENSPLAVIEFDAQFRITRWSDEAVKMFGWTASEVMGKVIGEFRWVCEKDADRVSAISRDMMSGKSPRNMHANRNYRKDGSVIHCEWYNSAMRDDAGNLVSILSQVLDVTERDRALADLLQKNEELNALNEEITSTQEELQQNVEELTRMERELRETSLYLENLILYANAPIIVWDKDLRITRFNHAFEVLTGRNAQEVTGERVEVLFPRKYVYGAMDLIRRTMTGERLDVVEIPILHKSGDIRIVLWNSATIYASDGKSVLSTIAQGQDITQRKLAEEMNLHAREEWERTFNTVPDLIAILDTHHRILRVNRAMAERLGTTPENCAGMVCHEVIHGTPSAPGFCPHSLTCADGKEHIVEVKEPALGGYFIVSTTPLFDADGNITGSVHVAHDITGRKQSEEELKRKHDDLNAAYAELTSTQEELQQNVEELSKREQELSDSLAEKEILLSEIHHRVKNNLTAFISLLSLEGSYEDSPAGRALKQDLQNRARSMALIHETLYRTKKYSSVDMDVYLGTLVEQVAASYASEKDIRTFVEADGIIADLTRATPCGLIVNELVTNSFKYAFPDSFDCEKECGEPCTIRISLAKEDGFYVLKVRDNGIGLPEEIDIATTKSLGLKLVAFLARHQLRAKIDVVKEKGSEYIFRFP